MGFPDVSNIKVLNICWIFHFINSFKLWTIETFIDSQYDNTHFLRGNTFFITMEIKITQLGAYLLIVLPFAFNLIFLISLFLLKKISWIILMLIILMSWCVIYIVQKFLCSLFDSALPKIIKTGFSAINLIYFFTAGPDEVTHISIPPLVLLEVVFQIFMNVLRYWFLNLSNLQSW